MERNENGFRVRNGSQGSQNNNFSCPGTGDIWNGGQNNGLNMQNGNCASNCSNQQLAMVYAPKQCWRMIFSPSDALRHGTLFEELHKPLEGYENV